MYSYTYYIYIYIRMYMYYILRINLRIMNYSRTVKKIVEFIFKNIYNDGYVKICF